MCMRLYVAYKFVLQCLPIVNLFVIIYRCIGVNRCNVNWQHCCYFQAAVVCSPPAVVVRVVGLSEKHETPYESKTTENDWFFVVRLSLCRKSKRRRRLRRLRRRRPQNKLVVKSEQWKILVFSLTNVAQASGHKYRNKLQQKREYLEV